MPHNSTNIHPQANPVATIRAIIVYDKSTMPSPDMRSNTYNDRGTGHRKIKHGIANILIGRDDGCDERGIVFFLFISTTFFT